MKLNQMTKPLIFLSSVLFVIFFSAFNGDIRIGCPPVLAKGKTAGPPKHANAHGCRAKYTYRYYPSVKAYYDVNRGSYFYLEGSSWRMSVSLPSVLRVQLGDYVSIEMGSDKPYTNFEEHQQKYPPGQVKKKWAKKK